MNCVKNQTFQALFAIKIIMIHCFLYYLKFNLQLVTPHNTFRNINKYSTDKAIE